MQLFKFSLISLVIFSNTAWAFDDNACLQTQFDVRVSHKAAPLGLSKNVLDLKKDGCVISIEHTKYFFIKKSWKIDVCREPVHIKQTGSSVNVLKRTHQCNSGDVSEYCADYFAMREMIQDDGLIFAEGEKENLNSDHGKVYCAYVLMDAHLQRGIVLSRDQNYEGMIVPVTGKTGPAQTVPVTTTVTPAPEVEATPVIEMTPQATETQRPLEPSKNDSSTGTF